MKKQFLRGLGVGIILTALVLCIFYRKETSESKIIQQAKELGMSFSETIVTKAAIEPTVTKKPVIIVTPKPTLCPTKKPVATKVPIVKVTAAPTIKPTIQPAVKPTIKPTVKPTIKPTVKPTVKPTTKPTWQKGVVKTITVKSGMSSSTVAQLLEKADLVANWAKYDSYLTRNGYADRIVCGKYRIKTGATYKQIAQIIT